MKKNNINKESLSFDKQIIERINQGYIPDLRRNKRNEWFNNSVWRDPFYTDMFFGEIVRKINSTIKMYYENDKKINILEVCCGPGHISLELGREGHNVTGIDISKECIKIAKKTAYEDSYIKKNNNIKYLCENIHTYKTDDKYDLIIFCNSLHHFDNLKIFLKKIDLLLDDKGVIFVTDPTRNDLTLSDATIIHMIRVLLSLGSIYFENVDIPETKKQFLKEITKIKQEFSYKDSEHKNLQSPFDGSSNFLEMHEGLKMFFIELEMNNDFSFFDKIIGGVRTSSINMDKKVAIWLRDMDKILLNNKIMSSKQFTFIGGKI